MVSPHLDVALRSVPWPGLHSALCACLSLSVPSLPSSLDLGSASSWLPFSPPTNHHLEQFTLYHKKAMSLTSHFRSQTLEFLVFIVKPLNEVILRPHPSVSAQTAQAPGTGWEGFLPRLLPSLGKATHGKRRPMPPCLASPGPATLI